MTGGSFRDCPHFRGCRSTRCQLYSLILCLLCILVLYPLVALVAAIHVGKTDLK